MVIVFQYAMAFTGLAVFGLGILVGGGLIVMGGAWLMTTYFACGLFSILGVLFGFFLLITAIGAELEYGFLLRIFLWIITYPYPERRARLKRGVD